MAPKGLGCIVSISTLLWMLHIQPPSPCWVAGAEPGMPHLPGFHVFDFPDNLGRVIVDERRRAVDNPLGGIMDPQAIVDMLEHSRPHPHHQQTSFVEVRKSSQGMNPADVADSKPAQLSNVPQDSEAAYSDAASDISPLQNSQASATPAPLPEIAVPAPMEEASKTDEPVIRIKLPGLPDPGTALPSIELPDSISANSTNGTSQLCDSLALGFHPDPNDPKCYLWCSGVPSSLLSNINLPSGRRACCSEGECFHDTLLPLIPCRPCPGTGEKEKTAEVAQSSTSEEGREPTPSHSTPAPAEATHHSLPAKNAKALVTPGPSNERPVSEHVSEPIASAESSHGQPDLAPTGPATVSQFVGPVASAADSLFNEASAQLANVLQDASASLSPAASATESLVAQSSAFVADALNGIADVRPLPPLNPSEAPTAATSASETARTSSGPAGPEPAVNEIVDVRPLPPWNPSEAPTSATGPSETARTSSAGPADPEPAVNQIVDVRPLPPWNPSELPIASTGASKAARTSSAAPEPMVLDTLTDIHHQSGMASKHETPAFAPVPSHLASPAAQGLDDGVAAAAYPVHPSSSAYIGLFKEEAFSSSKGSSCNYMYNDVSHGGFSSETWEVLGDVKGVSITDGHLIFRSTPHGSVSSVVTTVHVVPNFQYQLVYAIDNHAPCSFSYALSHDGVLVHQANAFTGRGRIVRAHHFVPTSDTVQILFEGVSTDCGLSFTDIHTFGVLGADPLTCSGAVSSTASP